MTDYLALGAQLGDLLSRKQEAYGDSFSKSGDVLRLMYPRGVSPEQYDDLLAMVRVIDKLFRIASRKDAFGESPWQDIAGYALLALANEQEADDGVS
jgi:hypothetical protein